ncbi:MAG TPA: hypothetical protein VFK06_02625 [Candidatus Angelobacter sp.]|nr:hypothetical protein [Candidatus Angelobacter sp.]
MEFRISLCATVSVLSVLLSSALQAQLPSTSRLEIEGPRDVQRGQSGKFNVKLVDTQGHPVTSNSDIKLQVNAPGAQLDRQVVIIRRGSSSAEVNISKQQPGISSINVQQVETPGLGLAAATEVGLASDESYKPVPPLSLWVSVQPQAAKFKAGLETATIIVRWRDSHKFTIPAQRDIKVAFPGVENALSSGQISMARGDPYAEAKLMESQPQVVSLDPVSNPPMSIFSDTNSVEFVSPIAALKLIPDHSYLKAVRHPSIKVKIGLFDGLGNLIASDHDRTIVLQVDPPSAGTLSSSDVTIAQGQKVVEATFIPTTEGKVTIKALTGEMLAIQNADIEFYYAAAYFWMIAALGGLIGGAVKNVLGADHSRKTIVSEVGGGLAVGVLAYVLAPLLIALSLKPAGLENGSKIFEAFFWGFFGGGMGVALLRKIFPGADPQPSRPQILVADRGA